MTKNELIIKLQKKLKKENNIDITKSEIKIIYDSLIELIKDEFTDGANELPYNDFDNKIIISIPLLGKFSIKNRSNYVGKNPSTGEAVRVKSDRVINFKASKNIKKCVKRK